MSVLLTAANGRTGRKILTALATAGAEVRVFIRDPEQWPALQAIGAAGYALGDLEDQASIDAAVKGCAKIVHIGPPVHPREREMTARLRDAAARFGLAHFVYYSVMHPLLRGIRHHRLKLDTEQDLIESTLTWSIVQPARYMQALEKIWPALLESGVHTMPFSTTQRFNLVDLDDLAEATARVATEPGHEFACYELAGPEALNQRDMAATIGRILGREIRAEAQSLADMEEKARAAGGSDDLVRQLIDMNGHYDAHGFRGNPNVLSWLLGRPPTRFAEYVQRLAAN